jgi:hypothetical protein
MFVNFVKGDFGYGFPGRVFGSAGFSFAVADRARSPHGAEVRWKIRVAFFK